MKRVKQYKKDVVAKAKSYKRKLKKLLNAYGRDLRGSSAFALTVSDLFEYDKKFDAWGLKICQAFKEQVDYSKIYPDTDSITEQDRDFIIRFFNTQYTYIANKIFFLGFDDGRPPYRVNLLFEHFKLMLCKIRCSIGVLPSQFAAYFNDLAEIWENVFREYRSLIINTTDANDWNFTFEETEFFEKSFRSAELNKIVVKTLIEVRNNQYKNIDNTFNEEMLANFIRPLLAKVYPLRNEVVIISE